MVRNDSHLPKGARSISPKFQGIIPPLVTPLLDRDTLDAAGLERLLNHVIAGGVAGVFVLGTTGEAPSLSYRLRREVIEQTCKFVAGRIPVLVGITDTAFVESVTLAKCAANAGADALVLSTPYYFPAGQTELTAYVERLLPELPLPLMLYNMPSLTKVWFEIETLKKLADHPAIVGVKDSSGDFDYFQNLLSLRKLRADWSLLIGPEHLMMSAVEAGGDGGVNGGANLFPRLFSQAYEVAKSGDKSRAAELQSAIDQLQEIYTIGKYASRHIKATKSGLSLLGICHDSLAEPFNAFLPPERSRVAAILEKLQADFEVCRVI